MFVGRDISTKETEGMLKKFISIVHLIASTVLILLLMPTFYLIIDKRSRKEKRLVKKEERQNRREDRKAEKASPSQGRSGIPLQK